ncbi:MAG: PIN domain-containing protein [Pyrinomonadaceae bacterium]
MAEAFIDTSFVIALTNKSDQYHAQALELARQFDNQQLLTTDAVLLEIGNALARKFKQAGVAIVEHFLSSDEVEIVNLDPELFRRAFELYRSHIDKEWGLIDCVSFVVMRDFGLSNSLTADRHFEQAGFTALLRSVETA